MAMWKGEGRGRLGLWRVDGDVGVVQRMVSAWKARGGRPVKPHQTVRDMRRNLNLKLTESRVRWKSAMFTTVVADSESTGGAGGGAAAAFFAILEVR